MYMRIALGIAGLLIAAPELTLVMENPPGNLTLALIGAGIALAMFAIYFVSSKRGPVQGEV